MRKLSKSYSIEKICSFTRAIVWMDIAINLSAGFVLLFDPPLANRLLFNAVVLPGWLYRLLQLLPAARIFLWAANGYMVLLGGLYWGLAEKYH